MTIKDVATRTGLTHQAIYKRLKARGLSVSDLKDKQTGQLTEEGERILAEMFPSQTEAPGADNIRSREPEGADSTQVEKLRKEVEKLSTEVELLRNQAAALEEKNKALTEERDFLRLSLERSQQLQAITASKIPNPSRLPASEAEGISRGGILGSVRSWWKRRRSPDPEVTEEQSPKNGT